MFPTALPTGPGYRRREPFSIAKLAEVARATQEAFLDAIERRGTRQELRTAKQELDARHWHQLALFNPWSRLRYMELLSGALKPGFQGVSALEMITIVDSDWHVGLNSGAIDIPKIKKTVQNRLRGLSGVLQVEFAFFRTARHKNGEPLLAPHVQGLVWGNQTRRERQVTAERFPGGAYGARGVLRKKVYDLKGAIGYMVKPPLYACHLYQLRNGNFASRGADLTRPQRFKLWQRLHHYNFPSLLFSMGEGAFHADDIRSLSRKWARLQFPPC